MWDGRLAQKENSASATPEIITRLTTSPNAPPLPVMAAPIIIHTDGACSGNPGPGGWGAILHSGEHVKEIKGGAAETTNNRMELTAAIEALSALKRPSSVELHTDSTYVRDGITKWIHGWKANGWRTAAKKPVKNEDLWRQLDELAGRHEIDWRWVKGHAGNPGNERADALANEGMDTVRADA